MTNDHSWRERLRDDSGATAVIVLLVLVFVLVPLAALVVDLGMVYVEHQRLQTAADAAALAGVARLFVVHDDHYEWDDHHHSFDTQQPDKDAAHDEALRFATQNAPEDASPQITVGDTSVIVDLNDPIQLAFAPVMPGVTNPFNVTAHARAVLTFNPDSMNPSHDGDWDHDCSDSCHSVTGTQTPVANGYVLND